MKDFFRSFVALVAMAFSFPFYHSMSPLTGWLDLLGAFVFGVIVYLPIYWVLGYLIRKFSSSEPKP